MHDLETIQRINAEIAARADIKREMKIALPVNNNEGQPLAHLHRVLQRRLVEIFGGATITNGNGIWVDPKDGRLYDEVVLGYTVAGKAADEAKLKELVPWLKAAGRQEAIYWVGFDGAVHIE